MDVDARIEALEAENDRLRGELEAALAALGLTFMAPVSWMLTGHEMRLVGALLAKPFVTKDAAMTAIYAGLHIDDQPQVKIVDVFVCKARKKLKPFGFRIDTRWGEGYFIAPDVRQAMLAAIAAEAAQ